MQLTGHLDLQMFGPIKQLQLLVLEEVLVGDDRSIISGRAEFTLTFTSSTNLSFSLMHLKSLQSLIVKAICLMLLLKRG